MQVPLGSSDEIDLFGQYVTSFVQAREAEARADADAPFVMIRSAPERGGEVKVVTFQEPETARAFSTGWSLRRSALRRG